MRVPDGKAHEHEKAPMPLETIGAFNIDMLRRAV